ncbi:probable fibrosin-1 isoform X1 [Pelobates fuscus]|uniref:probable fibrosin-1 isoform X1 n=1 Tax=Pelobates fuscus TaxID=191477 RepID=UPI002FE4CABC
MEAQPHTPRVRSGPRIPHRRSKSQRDRQRGLSPANSSSSSPDTAHWPRPPRKKRRRRKGGESTLFREEDLIDGFCISSYGSLEAMQRDVSLDSAPREEAARKHPTTKRKRSDEASSDDPGASGLENRMSIPINQKKRRRYKEQRQSCPAIDMEITCAQRGGPAQCSVQGCLSCCLDTGYICDAESSCDEQVPGDDLAVSFTVSTSTASPPLSGGRLKLLVLSQISGLSRSCERSPEQECEAILPKPCQSPAPPRRALGTPTSVVPSASPKAQLAPIPTTSAPDPGHNSTGRSSVSKPVSAPRISQRPTTPSLSLTGHMVTHNFPSALRPPSHRHMGLFAPSPGLPPPPPLLQVTGHPSSTVTAVLSEHDMMAQDIGSRFLTAPGADLSTSLRPMYQFHHHNHQHTHQHTHQHFAPYPHNVGSATFEKYPAKIESLYRQNFFPPYSPVITALSPVLPPNVSFGSLQGAFQPKSTSSELASRCSVPSAVGHKNAQLTDQFKPRRSGRWCAMHVRVAYMILRHQERLKLAHGTHKYDFRGDLLSCLPPGLGSLPTSHELVRPSSLFTGTMSHTPNQYRVTPPTAASFLPPSGSVDPFNRTSGFSSLASLTNGAFGGLGGPSYNPSTVFNQKESPTMHSFPSPHDAWNRLHRTPPSFPIVCPKPGDMDAHSSVLIKEEKDRDLLFSRLGTHASPLTSSQRLPGGEERGPSRTISPYVGIRPGSSSEIKPRLTPDHPPKVKVKEEPEVLTFDVSRSTIPGLHLPHTSPTLERFRGAFLGDQFPHSLEPWRDLYRRADPAPLRLPPVPPRLYEQREERAHILREDFERARVYGMPTHVTMQPATPPMIGSLYPHPGATLLRKTPPINLLSAPPPLISTSRPGSPHRRDIYKERDSR